METYELACELLLKAGEPCWNCGGNIFLDKKRTPHLRAWVIVGEKEAGERREAEFVYADSDWRELAIV